MIRFSVHLDRHSPVQQPRIEQRSRGTQIRQHRTARTRQNYAMSKVVFTPGRLERWRTTSHDRRIAACASWLTETSIRWNDNLKRPIIYRDDKVSKIRIRWSILHDLILLAHFFQTSIHTFLSGSFNDAIFQYPVFTKSIQYDKVQSRTQGNPWRKSVSSRLYQVKWKRLVSFRHGVVSKLSEIGGMFVPKSTGKNRSKSGVEIIVRNQKEIWKIII